MIAIGFVHSAGGKHQQNYLFRRIFRAGENSRDRLVRHRNFWRNGRLPVTGA